MTYEQSAVQLFHKEFGIGIAETPCIPSKQECTLRIALIDEELQELANAFEANDMVGVADGLGDLLYVVLGCAVTCGIDLETIFHEVHRSNMTKRGGHKAENGKWIKPSTYNPPVLLPILERQGYNGTKA